MITEEFDGSISQFNANEDYITKLETEKYQLTQDLATAQAEIKELHEYDLAQKSKLITATHNLAEAQADIARLRGIVADLSAVVRVQNGNRYDDINAMLLRAEQALSQSPPLLTLQSGDIDTKALDCATLIMGELVKSSRHHHS